MYRVFAVKTRKNAIRCAIQEDERAKRGVSRVHPYELSSVLRFSGFSLILNGF